MTSQRSVLVLIVAACALPEQPVLASQKREIRIPSPQPPAVRLAAPPLPPFVPTAAPVPEAVRTVESLRLEPALAQAVAKDNPDPAPALAAAFDESRAPQAQNQSAPASAPVFAPLVINASRGSLGTAAKRNAFVRAVKEQWRIYKSAYTERQAAYAPAVSQPAAFFAKVFGMGQILGTQTCIGAKTSLSALMRAARQAFDSCFPRTPAARKAFGGFLQRVLMVDGSTFTNHTRKRVQQALLEASLLPARQVAGYFEGLISPAYLGEVQEFRAARQPAIISSFSREAEELIRALSRQHPGPDRYNVAGIIVMGSFAYGTALPESDLDVYVLTWQESSRDVQRFLAALESRRPVHGWPHWKDLDRNQNVYSIADPMPRQLVREYRSLVISPYPEVVHAFTVPVSQPFYRASSFEKAVHRLAEPLYNAVVRHLIH